MDELLGIASQLEELSARLAVLKELHSHNVDAEARLEAAHQLSRRAAKMVRRQLKTMRPSK